MEKKNNLEFLDINRAERLILDAIEWAIDVSEQTTHDLLRGMGITSEELEILGYEEESFPDLYKWVRE